MEKRNIGIVMPVIGQLSFTQEALRSVTSSHHVVTCIIDNGSTDGTVEWLKLYHSDSSILNGQNAGLTVAWNQGMEFCRTRGCAYVLLSNNDVLYHPKTIDNLVAALDAHPDWGMATAVNEAGRFLENPQGIFDMDIPTEPTNAEHPDFSCFMLRVSAYDQVGPFDEEFSRRGKAFAEDNDYHYRLQLLGIPARCITDAPYFHYGSLTASALGISSHKNIQYFIEKWGGMPGSERFKTPFNQ